jgi:hypothetical protein
MKPAPEWLASRIIVAIEPDGTEQEVTLRIGTPFEISPDEWACACAMQGCHESLGPIHGIDAWQAIQLALNLQQQLLGYMEEDGTRFLYPDSREPLSLGELFPRPPRSGQSQPTGDA